MYKDIDIGFNTVSSLKQNSLILEKELNFRFVSFRYYKNVHAETGKDLSEEEIIEKSRGFVDKGRIKKFIDTDFVADIENCSNVLGLEKNTVISLIRKIKNI